MTKNKATERAWHDWMHNPVKVQTGEGCLDWDRYEFNARRCESVTGPAIELKLDHTWEKYGAKRTSHHAMCPSLSIEEATKLRDKLTSAIDMARRG